MRTCGRPTGLVLAVCGVLTGCDGDRGATERDADASESRGDDGGAVSVDGDGAVSVDGGDGAWLLLDDFEMGGTVPIRWTVHVGSRSLPTFGSSLPTVATEPPRHGSARAMRLEGRADAEGVDVNTHMHLDWGANFSAIRFWARTGGPRETELVVAVTALQTDSAGYFGDLAAGRPWRARRLTLATEWRLYSIPFAELQPEGAGEVVPLFGPDGLGGGSQLHFVLPEGQSFDLWLDDVALRCASDHSVCAGAAAR